MYNVQEIDIDLIEDNPYDQRKRSGDIEGLAASIKERGLQNPISVIKVEDHYVIVSGHRRTHAFRYLKRKKIPVIIRRESTPTDLKIDLAVENLQRKDLLPAEKGATLEQLLFTIPNTQNSPERAQTLLNQIKSYGKYDEIGEGFTDEDILNAKKLLDLVGMSTTTASIHMRLCSLPEDIQKNIVSGAGSIIPDGHIVIKSAYELTRVDDPELQKELYQKAIDDKMTHIEVKHVVDELISKNGAVARKTSRGSSKRRTEDDGGASKLTRELLTLSSNIENFRCKLLPVLPGRLEKAQWIASLNKMKKVCLDTVNNINNLIIEDMKEEELLDIANLDLEISITSNLRYKFPSKMAEVLRAKEGDILFLKVEGIKRLPPKLDEVGAVKITDVAKIGEENIDENHGNRIDVGR